MIFGAWCVAVLGVFAIVGRFLAPDLRSRYWKYQWEKPRFGFHAFGLAPMVFSLFAMLLSSAPTPPFGFAIGAGVAWLTMLAWVEPGLMERLLKRSADG